MEPLFVSSFVKGSAEKVLPALCNELNSGKHLAASPTYDSSRFFWREVHVAQAASSSRYLHQLEDHQA